MDFEKAEKYRAEHPLRIPHKKGDDYGWFEVPSPIDRKLTLRIMVAPSDSDWQHISVSTNRRCPNWTEMCFIKDLFWDDTETVIQFHPPRKDYVNMAKTCLHLWRWTKGEIPRPPKCLVG